MSTWPNRGGLRRLLRGAEIIQNQQPKEVRPRRSDSSQQASSKPGAVHQIHIAGNSVAVVDAATGEVSRAQIFVATLGASNYTFACATPRQTTADWIPLSQVSGATTSLYAHQGGFAVMAANGPVSLRAHTDALSILADQSITVTSVNDEIRIAANEEIRLVAGQSAIALSGGDIEVITPGAFTAHGGTHAFEAGASGVAALPKLPVGLAAVDLPKTPLITAYSQTLDLSLTPMEWLPAAVIGTHSRFAIDSADIATRGRPVEQTSFEILITAQRESMAVTIGAAGRWTPSEDVEEPARESANGQEAMDE